MVLGLDIGTTKTAAVIIDSTKRVYASCSIEHNADRSTRDGLSEQDVPSLIDTVFKCVKELPVELRREIKWVGLTGQMHGVALVDKEGIAVSPLITWKDQRCNESPEFLKEIKRKTTYTLRTGFGCATLAWLSGHKALPSGAAASGTIMDIVATTLCGAKRPVIDPTNAASWGLFKLDSFEWDHTAVKNLGIDSALLPDVVPCGTQIGKVCSRIATATGIPSGIPVAVAIGDNQASLLSTLSDPLSEFALTIGTGAQLSAIIDKQDILPVADDSPYEYRPYPGGKLAIVAAPLCGGGAWAWLAESLENWFTDLGAVPPPRPVIYSKMDQLGLLADDSLKVKPHFLGERHDQSLRGEIAGIDMSNFSFGQLSRALAHGIIENIYSMLPSQAFTGRKRIVGSGNALRRTTLLQKKTEEIFQLPLVLVDGKEEAATGAALLAMQY